MSLNVTDDIQVAALAGPAVKSGNLKGSWRTVADTTARDAIPALFREAGMLVYTTSGSAMYQLANDLTTWSAVSFGGSGAGAAISVASGGALTATDDTTFVNGTIAYVQSFGDFFILAKNDTTTTTDGVTVLASFDGKRWLRVGLPTTAWARQSTWFIDFVAGSDENPGTALLPLKTRAELSRRLKGNSFLQNTTIQYVGNYTPKDPFDTNVAPTFTVTEKGTATTILTGTFTTVTAATGNLQDSFTDVAVPVWTSYFGKRITITSGPNTGCWSFIGYDLQAGEIMVSPWKQTSANGSVTNVRKPPTVGNTYKIETLSKHGATLIDTTADQSTVGSIQYRDFDFDNSTFLLTVLGRGAVPILVGCQISVVLFIQNKVQTSNCQWLYGAASYVGSQWECYGGMLHGFYGWFAQVGSIAYFYDGPFFTNSAGVYLQSMSACEMNGAQFFKTTAGFLGGAGSHITMDNGAVLSCPQRITGTERIYGDTATRRGITARAGANVTYKTTTAQTLTGTLAGGDAEFGTVDTARAWDEGTGTYTAPILLTWANLAGTLLDNAHSVATDAHITKVT